MSLQCHRLPQTKGGNFIRYRLIDKGVWKGYLGILNTCLEHGRCPAALLRQEGQARVALFFNLLDETPLGGGVCSDQLFCLLAPISICALTEKVIIKRAT